MKQGETGGGLDATDLRILGILQANCKLPWGQIGALVGLSAPSVIERARKLEESGVIRGYQAVLDSRALGLDVTAFIGVIIDRQDCIETFEREAEALADILGCHHVTGEYTFLLKVKTRNTAALETLIRRIRAVPGVARTETMVVLSTHTERAQLHLEGLDVATAKKAKRPAVKQQTELRQVK